MNTIKKLIILCIVVGGFSCKAQQLDNGNTNNASDINLIKGTWVAEGSNINYKWVFNENGTLKKYRGSMGESIYSFYIVNSINNGVKSKYLQLVNNSDASDWYKYEISILSNEKLILIYQRKNNMGLAKPATYIKQ